MFDNIPLIAISRNKITSLHGINGKTVHTLQCSLCPIKSLLGTKLLSILNLDANRCSLKTLVGMPLILNNIMLRGNDLNSLNGIQDAIHGTLDINGIDITDFTGFPTLAEKIITNSNKVKLFIKKLELLNNDI